MDKEKFRNLLSQWADEDVYIGQLTWEEADALAERLANWYASQQKMHPTNGGLCAICGRPEYAHSPNGHNFRPAISG